MNILDGLTEIEREAFDMYCIVNGQTGPRREQGLHHFYSLNPAIRLGWIRLARRIRNRDRKRSMAQSKLDASRVIGLLRKLEQAKEGNLSIRDLLATAAKWMQPQHALACSVGCDGRGPCNCGVFQTIQAIRSAVKGGE